MTNVVNSSSSSSGVGFFGLLTIVLIVLKLMEIINWSWWLVLLPFYGPILCVILFILYVYFFLKNELKGYI
jgi:hypothetical protein